MRVLFTTTPGRGHYAPMLPLAAALRARGHSVRFCAAPSACADLAEAGFEADPAGPEPQDVAALVDSRPDLAALPPAERPDRMFAVIFGPARVRPMLADLLPAARAWRPDLLVCDQAELAGPIAAAVLGVPSATHAFGALLPRIRIERGGEAVAEVWREHRLEPRPFGGAYDHLYLDIFPPSIQSPERAHLPDVELRRPADRAPRRPDPGEPLAYVTFGTVFSGDPRPMRTALEALAALPVRVIATTGPLVDPADLGPQPANVAVERFVPQAQLLPRCALVVSHGGSGTFLGALAHGVPQLLLPQGADQFINAAAAVRGRVGRALPPDELTVEAVREEAAAVLADAVLAERAAALAGEIAAIPAPDATAAALERRCG